MLKKSLIALALVAFLGLPAMAHEDWGFTSETIVNWGWVSKGASVNPIPVKMKIVMWADVYWNQDNHWVEIVQVDGSTFIGCANLKVCVNFGGLKIKAEFTETQDVADKWYLSLVPSSDSDSYGGDNGKTELLVPDPHLSSAQLPVRLCVKATGVDPQALNYSMGQLVDVGVVNLTLIPTIAP